MKGSRVAKKVFRPIGFTSARSFSLWSQVQLWSFQTGGNDPVLQDELQRSVKYSQKDLEDLAQMESGGFHVQKRHLEDDDSNFEVASYDEQIEIEKMLAIESQGRPELVEWMKDWIQ